MASEKRNERILKIIQILVMKNTGWTAEGEHQKGEHQNIDRRI
jgi:hypothetical protein